MSIKSIGVLTTGRDVSGANAAIRAIVRKAKNANVRCSAIQNGFNGLIDNDIKRITTRDVSGKIGKASSFLGSSYIYEPFSDEKIKKMLDNLKKNEIDGLVLIGGGGAFKLSQPLAEAGVPIIGIPATIQDDVVGTDICLGVDSAVNNIMQCVDHIRSCDSSRNRSFIVQVDGNVSGSLAARAALVTGAEMLLIPEHNAESLEPIAKEMSKSIDAGKTQCITILSSGWKPGIQALSQFLEEHEKETDLVVRRTILGYVQRGGSPTGFDRLLGTRLGAAAVDALLTGVSNHFVGIQNEKLVRVPLSETLDKYRYADPKLLELVNVTI